MTLYLSVLFAALIYALIDYLGKEGSEIFTKKYILTFIVNVLAGSYLIWAFKFKPEVFMVGNIDLMIIVAGAFGIFGQKLFKSIMHMANRQIKTKLNLYRNKK